MKHLTAVGGSVLLLAVASPVYAQCAGSSSIFAAAFNNLHLSTEPGCAASGGFICEIPEVLSGPLYVTTPPGCDPSVGACGVDVITRFAFPGNTQNGNGVVPWVFWFNTASIPADFRTTVVGHPNAVAACGLPGAELFFDEADTWVAVGGVTCSNVGSFSQVYSIGAYSCPTTGPCEKLKAVEGFVAGGPAMAQAIGCENPPVDECDDCKSCPAGDSGANSGGGGPTVSPQATGPGARLRYRAGGAGFSGLPGSAAHSPGLGRGWSHDYAQRIVPSPDESHVWLITEFGSFREFSSLEAAGPALRAYQTNSPSDEYRTLFYDDVALTWELGDLDGSIMTFDAMGRFTTSADSAGNTKTATYDASGQLETVSFPDARTETFAYNATTDKLETLTETGVGGSTTRVWTYTWTGEDLTRIDRPDGTAWKFFYTDASFPGYITRQELEGADGTSIRVERGWEYDTSGNVTKTWKGDTTFAGANAVDKWELAFDNATLPTSTQITDPLGNVSTYTIGRDSESLKTRVIQTSGDCPTCGLGPNTTFEHNDPNHPLLPTAIIDGAGNRTQLTYNANGRVTSRIEAFGDPEERETTWEYTDTGLPGLPTAIIQESIDGAPSERRTDLVYGTTGNATARTISGVESGSSFSHTTTTVYNGSGLPLSIDPPGFSTTDQTSFTYDATRGDLFALTRTDPVIGALGVTSSGYDAFNRRTSITDPNGVETATAYDALNRATTTTQKGTSAPEDLVTSNAYNTFGDLEKTTLPEGNVIEYAYDGAGRLEAIARGQSPGGSGNLIERTFYTLDNFGNRTKEELQSWNGASWTTESETDFVYTTRCQLDEILRAPGTPEESVTEYNYDCNGNLESVWDANHDSGTDPASQLYAYDALDRLTSITQPWAGAGGGTATTTYGYDVQDHLTSVTDAEGNLTTYLYSDRDLLTRQVSPVSGTTEFLYNEHGELVTETDARAVVTTRTVDELDRVTFVDYADNSLDTTYAYDTGSFGIGRLGSITRSANAVSYTYDRFGRTLQDGGLAYTYDKNGNRETVTYPSGAIATYGFDFSDRDETLSVTTTAGSQSLVTAATYKPSGPLATAALGHGLTETRTYDSRYFPAAIDLSGGLQRTWTYTTDKVGNILQIDETVGCTPAVAVDGQTLSSGETFEACVEVSSMDTTVDSVTPVTYRAGELVSLGDGFNITSGAEFVAVLDDRLVAPTSFVYDYQDQHYFLTVGDGPWGTRDYTYDKVGNRTSEDRDGVLDNYTYTSSGSGNTPILQSLTLGVGGTRDYTYGPAGHLEDVTAGANVIDFTSDEAGRLTQSDRLGNQATMLYDGRSFLEEVTDPATGATTEPIYSSDGLLACLARTPATAGPTSTFDYFQFAGRPIAQLETDGAAGGAETWTFLTTDHLGTPAIATDLSGTEMWLGPYEPFGRDYLAGTTYGASENAIFLRFPGQWDDGRWGNATLGVDIYYNVHRWYERGTGRYSRPDPMGLVKGDTHEFVYATSNPLLTVDLLGLTSFIGFPPDKERQARDAVQRTKEKLEDQPCCVPNAKKLLKRLDNVTIVFRKSLSQQGQPLCGRVGPGDFIRRRIKIGSPAFAPRCGALECTILHELFHLGIRNAGEGAATKAEKDCFGCGTGKPPDD